MFGVRGEVGIFLTARLGPSSSCRSARDPPRQQLVPLALVLSLLLSLGTGIAFGLGWARPSRLRKLASSDFAVDRGR
jgi:hypothetical protein